LGPGRYFGRGERRGDTHTNTHCYGDSNCHTHRHCNGIGHAAPDANGQTDAINTAASHTSATAIIFTGSRISCDRRSVVAGVGDIEPKAFGFGVVFEGAVAAATMLRRLAESSALRRGVTNLKIVLTRLE
jgi:hypothetical protein